MVVLNVIKIWSRIRPVKCNGAVLRHGRAELICERYYNNKVHCRNPSIEVFRCLLMFLIVLGHSWGEGIFFPGRGICTEVDWWVFLMVGMLIWHVDGFIAISGWFCIRYSWKKFFYLLGTIFFYTVVFGVYELWNGRSFSFGMLKLRSGWFGGTYLALMFAAPFINSAIDSMASRSRRALFGAWLLLAMALFFTWAPGHLFTGINALGFGHQTFGMMVFVYLTARTARCVFNRPIPLNVLGLLSVLYVAYVVGNGIVLDCIGNTSNAHFWRIWNLGLQNHSPIVYLPAIIFLLIFVWYVKIPNWLGRIALFVSPCMFGVYLFHCSLLIYSEEWLYGHVSWHPFWIMLTVSLFAFFMSVCVDLIRRALVSLWRGRVNCVLVKIDEVWNRVVIGASII